MCTRPSPDNKVGNPCNMAVPPSNPVCIVLNVSLYLEVEEIASSNHFLASIPKSASIALAVMSSKNNCFSFKALTSTA